MHFKIFEIIEKAKTHKCLKRIIIDLHRKVEKVELIDLHHNCELLAAAVLSGGKVEWFRQNPVLRIERKRGATMADDKKDKRKELDDDLANLDADYAKLKADLAKFRADCEEIGPREI